MKNEDFADVIEQLPVGIVIANGETGAILRSNAKARAILVAPIEASSEADYAHFGAIHEDDTPYAADEYPLVRLVRGAEDFQALRMRYRVPDGTVLDLEVSGRMAVDEDGGKTAIVTFDDVSDRRRAERQLENVTAQLARILETTKDAVMVIDRDMKVLFVNETAGSLLFKGKELMGRRLWDVFPARRNSLFARSYATALETGEAQIETEFVAHADAYFEARSFPSGGQLTVFLRDVSAEVLAGETRQLLVRELNHRVKNLFAVVNGMISMTARETGSSREMAEALRSRIFALARAHELIRPAVTMETYKKAEVSIQNLISALIEPHLSAESDYTVLQGPAVTLGASGATTLALVFHELATNAAKYGALSASGGLLTVKWQVENDRVTIEWIETGGPVVTETPETNGFGSKLIKISVEQQLQGVYEKRWPESGLHAVLQIPMARLEL